MIYALDFTLDQSEVARIKEFFYRLDIENKRFFCSDDFRKYKLDRFWTEEEKVHKIGLLFSKLVVHKFVVQRGEVPSDIPTNNRRKNDLFERTGKFEKWIKQQQRLDISCLIV